MKQKTNHFSSLSNVGGMELSEPTKQLLTCLALLADVRRYLCSEFENRLANVCCLDGETSFAVKAVGDAEDRVMELMSAYSTHIRLATDFKKV